MIIFILLTVVLTYIYYTYNQCRGWYDLFWCIIISLLTQFIVVVLLSLIIEFYFHWLTSY